MKIGKKNWVFCDGYLPPKGDNPEFEGHEALMLTNLNKEKAKMELVFVFEDREPETGIFVELDGGILKIQIAVDNTIFMTGPAETIYEGETEIC